MDLEELQAMSEIDTDINEHDIAKYTLALPAITSKWLRLLSNARIRYEALEIELNIKRKERGHYFRFESDYKFRDNKHFDELMNGDKVLNTLRAKLVVTAESISFIDGVIKILNATSFNIKNHIEWKKFSSGGY